MLLSKVQLMMNCDFITQGWTNKDWALNLLPLGGIACIAYEADDSGEIVPPDVLDPTANDPCEIVPQDVMLETFSYLNLHQLGVSSRVSKKWNPLISTLNLWKTQIYREIAFSSKNWAQWDIEIVKGVDFTKEMLSLPDNIVEELRRSYQAFPGKRITETHVLVRMPKGLTIKKLGELAKKYFPSNADGYRYIWPGIIDALGDKPCDEFDWLLMTTSVIDGTRNKDYTEQKNIVAKLAKTTQVPYEVPRALQAATCILAEYSRSEKRLFNNRPWTFTHCQERVQDYQVVVGGFAPAGPPRRRQLQHLWQRLRWRCGPAEVLRSLVLGHLAFGKGSCFLFFGS